jgi:hypothetical protein
MWTLDLLHEVIKDIKSTGYAVKTLEVGEAEKNKTPGDLDLEAAKTSCVAVVLRKIRESNNIDDCSYWMWQIGGMLSALFYV